MSSYLYTKFKNIYRVLPDLDLATHDVPRDEKGNIDGSYDDYFIPSTKYKIEVRHATRNNLTCFVWSITQMRNIGIGIAKKLCGIKYKSNNGEVETVYQTLKDKGVITDFEVLDGEGWFSIKTDMLTEIGDILALKTIGAKIAPLSPKNLPKSKIKLRYSESLDYNNLWKQHPNLTPLDKARIVKNVNKAYEAQLSKTDLNKMKSQFMTAQQYASHTLDFDKYLKLLQKELDNE